MIWIPKGWGGEEIIVNNEKYCGKILHFIKGKKCSLHYHERKAEHFHVLDGKLKVYYSDDLVVIKKLLDSSVINVLDVCDLIILEKNDTFEVPVGRVHQIIALENTKLLEISTQDFPEDSIRLIKGD